MSFGHRLIELRKEKGLTQNELASLLGKGRSTVSGYETEGKEPDYDKLCFLAEYFGVTTDYLLDRDDERTPAASLFHNDTKKFRERFVLLPAEAKTVVAEIFDAFYLLLNRDMRSERLEYLTLYRDLTHTIRASRHEIKLLIADNTEGPDTLLPRLLEKENALKNEVAVVLDKLMEIDLKG